MTLITEAKMMTDDLDPQKYYRLKSTAAVALLESALTAAGQSFKTKITITKKRGREFLVLLLDV
jgi:hypothetical protein